MTIQNGILMKFSKLNNVFSGENSVIDFINPDYSNPAPLVEIPKELNPYWQDGVRIFAKLMNMTPLGNVKSLPALNMLLEASKSGKLKNVDTLIENSSGNTVFSMSAIAKLLGLKSTKAVVSNEVTEGKLKLLKLFGVEIIVNEEPICPNPSDKNSGIYKAKVWAEENGWLNLGQYDNLSNPDSHYKWTGTQLWEQLEEDITVFCCGLGTTGTMVGTGGFLKKMNPSIQNVGIVRAPNNPVPGPRTKNLLSEIAFDWVNVVNEIIEIGTKKSYKTSLELIRFGLVVGPSSGFALSGLIKYLEGQKLKNNFLNIRNKNNEVVCAFICCDSPLAYIDEYFEYLDESYFVKIQNEELLKKHSGDKIEAGNLLQEISCEELLHLTTKNETVQPLTIIDLREESEYLKFHINGSTNIAYDSIMNNIELLKPYQNKTLYIVCNRGNKSRFVTQKLNKSSYNAYSVKNGMLEWSEKDFPRWKNDSCVAS
jgi:cysteine synthase/rhodanese-related sulfurtransferase